MQQTRHDTGWRGMTMSSQLGRHARSTPGAVALRFEGRGLTYAELDDRVTRLAHALADRGVRTGDRVAVLALNGTEVWESYLAGVRLGAVVVPVNFRLVADEVAYALTDSGAVALVVDDALAEVAAQACTRAPGVTTVLRIGAEYEAALAAASAEPLEVEVDESAPAFIMYTSGTTGRPKGAVLSHRNLLMHAFSQVVTNGVDPTTEKVHAPGTPMFHIAGLAGGLPPLLLGGTQVVLRSGGFDPVATLDLIERERVNSIFLVPAMWAAVVAVPGIADRDLSCLRRVSWGAAPASTTLLRSLIDTFPQAEVMTAFGQTECSPVTTLLRGEDSIRKLGSVGTPMLNVEVRVVDEQMQDVPQGQVGEIVYRSPMVMSGYWGKPPRPRRPSRAAGSTRRPRAAGRGRLLLRRRPQEGHDHQRRREHLLRRGGGRPGRAPRRRRGGADRGARRPLGRGAAGRAGRPRPGRPADPRRADRVVPGAAGPLQVPAGVPRRRRAPEEPQRQGPQDRAPRHAHPPPAPAPAE